jgi:hypothetical protein
MPRHQKALQDAQPLPENNDAMRVFRRVMFIGLITLPMVFPLILEQFVSAVYVPGALDRIEGNWLTLFALFDYTMLIVLVDLLWCFVQRLRQDSVGIDGHRAS